MAIAIVVMPFGSLLHAQNGRAAVEPLGIPDADSLRCRAQDAEIHRADSLAAFSYVFETGHELAASSRSIDVSYDSAGRVTSLRENHVTSLSPGNVVVDAVVAVFAPDGRSFGMRFRVAGSGSSPPDRERVSLTQEELTRARALAAWLWRRRCEKKPGG